MAAVALLPAGSAVAAELIMFEAPGCSYCRLWDREVSTGYPSSREGSIAPLRRAAAADWKMSGAMLSAPVTVTPTFVVVEEGREIGRVTGYPGAEFFYPLLSDVLEHLPRRGSSTTSHETSEGKVR